MKVLESRVLCSIEKGITQKMGGLEIPLGDVEVATVIEVGQDIEASEQLKKGDKIYIYPGSGKTFMNEGVEYRLITKSEIIVIL